MVEDHLFFAFCICCYEKQEQSAEILFVNENREKKKVKYCRDWQSNKIIREKRCPAAIFSSVVRHMLLLQY
jgi:hypothetical protein